MKSVVDRDVSLRKAIDKRCDFTLSLKVEQVVAVAPLLDGNDVLTVSSAGFGKSSIFQVSVIAAEMERERSQTELVLCPCCRFYAKFLEFFDERASMGRRRRCWKISFSSQGFRLIRTILNCNFTLILLIV